MKNLRRYHNTDILFKSLTQDIKEKMDLDLNSLFYLAISGGNTAIKMFDYWINKNLIPISWERIRFFWVDERCVPPNNSESNYFQAKKHLFEPLNIPMEHIFRIKGEKNPHEEASEYGNLINNLVPHKNNKPAFNTVILGTGLDGHTASIFPNNLSLLTNNDNYAVVQHPEKPQMRISMTGTLILNADSIILQIVGKEKKDIIKKIISDDKEDLYLPGNYIYKTAKNITLYLEYI